MATLRNWTRPLRHWVCALAVKSIQFIFRIVPRSWVRRIGESCGRALGLILVDTSRDLEARLSDSLPTPPTVPELWTDLGRRAAEFLVADRFTDEVILAPDALEIYQQAIAQNRGVLVATAHLGHWELMAAALAERGFGFASIAARPKAGPLGVLLSRHREALNVKTLAPGRGARDAVRRLRKGESVGIFIDQTTSERSRAIPFMGRNAPTPLTFERLLELGDAVPVFIWNYRDGSGRYVVHVEHVPQEDSLLWLTRRVESLVRTHPTQWVWLHKRWDDRGTRNPVPDEVPSLL